MILLLASHNPNKKKEIQMMLPNAFQVMDLNDIHMQEEIEENGLTLEENALIKVRFLYNILGINCIAEDSGLEIESLNGEPGVLSARYAGPQKNDKKNIQLVLSKMQKKTNRCALFRTVIAMILENKEYMFEGIIHGEIADIEKGEHGFGYDPIFIPKGYDKTFAQLGEEIKVKISHRSIAVKELLDFLQNQK